MPLHSAWRRNHASMVQPWYGSSRANSWRISVEGMCSLQVVSIPFFKWQTLTTSQARTEFLQELLPVSSVQTQPEPSVSQGALWQGTFFPLTQPYPTRYLDSCTWLILYVL